MCLGQQWRNHAFVLGCAEKKIRYFPTTHCLNIRKQQVMQKWENTLRVKS